MNSLKILASLLLSVCLFNSFQMIDGSNDKNGDYVIKGELRNGGSQWIFLLHSDKFISGSQLDSTQMIDGKFTFKGTVQNVEAFLFGLHARDKKTGKVYPSRIFNGPYILSPGELKVSGHIDSVANILATGTKEQSQYNSLKNETSQILKELNTVMSQKYNLKLTQKKEAATLELKIDKIRKQYDQVVKQHLLKNPSSFLSPYIASSKFINPDFILLRKIYDALATEIKASRYGVKLAQIIKDNQITAIGELAFPFSMPDSKGKLTSLESAKGTYTLIDFWASWCGPCRFRKSQFN